MNEEDIARLKAEAAGLVYMDVLDYQIDPSVLALVPETVARKQTVLPLYRVGNALTIVMDDPWNAVAIDEIRLSSKLPVIQPVLGTATAIGKAIERHYGHQVVEQAVRRAQDGSGAVAAAAAATAPDANGHAPAVASSGDAEVPVAKLVDALLTEAADARASDIHLEPDEDHLRVRFRVDGVLQEIKLLDVAWHEAMASRIKLLAKLDITEHRLPQDGSLPMTLSNRAIDLRVSTYPTVGGENVVIRLLDRETQRLNLQDLGFSPDMLAQVEALIRHPHGMVLVTGPTGSGKTTTLYAALSRINSMEKNLMTIEDPVEYRLPLIRQTQVNPKAGLTFAVGLRSLLRQDPDVIMVGEIRDHDTAEIAIHAALTGHLVLSTLHTNDALGAVARLIDMGVEPFLLASTLLGVIGQRLLRRVCPRCQEGHRPEPSLKARYPQLTVVTRGRGCRFCRQTGFQGRLGVFEVFAVAEAVASAIAARAPVEELRRLAGMRSMREDGMAKVQQGLTTLEELDRVVPDIKG